MDTQKIATALRLLADAIHPGDLIDEPAYEPVDEPDTPPEPSKRKAKGKAKDPAPTPAPDASEDADTPIKLEDLQALGAKVLKAGGVEALMPILEAHNLKNISSSDPSIWQDLKRDLEAALDE